jgi:site-specific DNA-methyltransferase (adenine-specific)
LKPAFEPWILARKPLSGTVAQTVTQWGTGAINVDACRIGMDDGDRKATTRSGDYGPTSASMFQTGDQMRSPLHGAGRWPANVVLSHAPECREVGTRKVKGNGAFPKSLTGSSMFGLDGHSNGERRELADADGTETVPAWECVDGCPVRLLDEQSGERPATARHRKAVAGRPKFDGKYNNGERYDQGADVGGGYGDTGGASRFFYTSKASRREREAGLEGMPSRGGLLNPYRTARCRVCGSKAKNAGQSEPGPNCGHGDFEWVEQESDRQSSNSHPTVKPLALMRWLCRLVTPPGGVILDPFAGSGSTGCAAVLEGFRFLGIEQEAEYVAIAERRITHWAATVKPEPQTELEVA